MKVEQCISPWEVNSFEVQDAGSYFLKSWRESFSLNEGCKVAKVFLRKKESNEEEGESNFLGSSEEEEGEQGSDLMSIRKDLDPDFFLKIDLMLMFFLTTSHFLWSINLLWLKFVLSLKWKMQRKLRRWRSFENKVFPFRKMVLEKKRR